MTRYYHPNPRHTVEQTRSISLSWLLKNGYLISNVTMSGKIAWQNYNNGIKDTDVLISTFPDNSFINLDYKTRKSINDDWTEINQTIRLIYTKCKYGGLKWFFVCGFNSCQNKVRSVYKGNLYFCCRHCTDLSYNSCNASNAYRSGMYMVLSKHWKSKEYLSTLKRQTYKGKATRKFKKYLKMSYLADDVIEQAENSINGLLTMEEK